MIKEMLKVKEDSKVPDSDAKSLQSWSQEIDYMIRLDGRRSREIAELFRWSQEDSFWCSNIRSPRKLREKWDSLELQRSNRKNDDSKKSKATSKKTRFHNFEQRSDNYSEKQLEDVATRKRRGYAEKLKEDKEDL